MNRIFMNHEFGHLKLVSIAIALFCLSALVGCSHSKPATDSGLKHYQLTGNVVAIDKPNKSLTVDGDEIPGFMSAMQMPYDVKDASLLDKLAPGDRIAADIVVEGDQSWLENIRVTKPPAPPTPPAKSTSSLRAMRAADGVAA
jgi:protein SCO1/2